jgi:peptide/nickel transport system ATP-binding protein
MTPLLQIEHLEVEYRGGARAVRGISMHIHEGEALGLVGESGCGKTTVARAVLGLLPRGTRARGSVRVSGHEIIGRSERELRGLRGRVVGLVAQDPFAALDPVHPVGHHVGQAWKAQRERIPAGAVTERLAAVGIDEAERRARQRPFQWSGGMLQRAQIAAASARRPPLLVADEPTSALDAERADEVLTVLRGRAEGLLIISHDLRVVRAHTDRVAVMYAGRIVEELASAELDAARHPYTQALLAAIPRPGAGLPTPLPGEPPQLTAPDAGCPFAPRCPLCEEFCADSVPRLEKGVACHVLS